VTANCAMSPAVHSASVSTHGAGYSHSQQCITLV